MSYVHDFEPTPAQEIQSELEAFNAQVDEAISYRVSFILHSDRWKSFRPRENLRWKSLKFTEHNLSKIPEVKGIYCFVFKENTSNIPTHGYILYVGIVHKGARNFRKRYREYLDEQRLLKRPKVSRMLSKFSGGLYFYYAEVDVNAVNLEELELQLASAVLPPAVTKDFTPVVRQIVSALAFH